MAAKSLLTTEQWAQARAMYEMGETPTRIGEAMTKLSGVEVNARAVDARRSREDWRKIDDASAQAAKQARAIVDGIVDGDTITRRAQIDSAADVKAGIIVKHRDDWIGFRQESSCLPIDDKNAQQCAKLRAEILEKMHNGERKAWGITDSEDDSRELRVVIERK